MAAIEFSNQEKVIMYLRHYDGGDSLTDIGEDYGVSRKTVRRRINEVQTFYDDLEVGDKFRDEDGDVYTVTHKDERIEEDMPVKTMWEYGSEPYWMDLSSLMDAIRLDEEEVEEEQEEETSEDSGFVGYATLNENCRYILASDTDLSVEVPVYLNDGSSGDGSYFIKGGDMAKISFNSFPNVTDWPVNENEITFVGTEVEEEQENAEYYVTAPQDSITIIRIDQDTGEVSTRQTNKHNSNFTVLRNRIKEDQSQDTLREVYIEMDTKRMLEAYSVGRVRVDVEAEAVVFVKPDGSERSVPDDISADIISTVRTHGKESGDKLVKFLDYLMDNPSFRSIEGFYRFMKHNCIEINDDGMITAWKGVRNDLYSCHAGKIKSGPTVQVREDGRIYNGNFGTEVRVDRSEVNDDPDQTCSHGLHVGNYGYATSFGEKTLKVSVNPADVVAVPYDYNGAKVRCCAYTPVEAI